MLYNVIGGEDFYFGKSLFSFLLSSKKANL